MKNYTITVNGKVYQVQVEEGMTSGAPAQFVPAAPAAPAPAPAAPAPAAASSSAPRAAGGGSVKVTAPMPGKILGVKASVGQSVSKGDVLMVLEAMKMENEIVAPEDGTIASIDVAAGDKVEPGMQLASLN